MIDPSIIEEAYSELNIPILKEGILPPEDIKIVNVNKDHVLERMKKLIFDIQSMLQRIDDSDNNDGEDDYSEEDDDIRDEMKTALKTSIMKMIERFEAIANKAWKEESEEVEKEGEDGDDEDDEDNDEDEDDEDNDEDENNEDNDEDDEDDEKKDNEPGVLTLFHTESITSPLGINYTIIETNENKSLLKDPQGETFKIGNDVLRKWKSNK